MAKGLPKRSEVPEEFTWNLKDMYADLSLFEADLKASLDLADELSTYAGKAAASAKNLLYVLETQAKLQQKLFFAVDFAGRLVDEDTGNNYHQGLLQKANSVYASVSEKLAFLSPEVLALDEKVLASYYEEEKGLEFYRLQIEDMQRLKPYTLSADAEKLLAMTTEMSQNPGQVFSIFNSAELKFPEIKDENGESVQLTNGRFIAFEVSPDRRVRKEAFETLYHTYKQYSNTLATVYSGQIKQLIFNARARHYASTLDAAVIPCNVSPKVYENLVNTVNANMDKLHRYISLRKRLLGYDELHMYDIYVPMIPDVDSQILYPEAKETILKALAPMGEDYIAKLKEGFDNRWVDVYENEGKAVGAYCAGMYGTHPFVLMNYTDTMDDMFTLAHEMGHAMHSCYSNENQPFIYAQYAMFVAEVASTCNEVLLLEYLLKNTTDRSQRAYLLNHYLDSFKGTLYRQTMFAEYELITNRMAEQGESLTADALTKVYHDLNEKYYGPDMISDEEIGYEWAKVPHMYMNFYVYQYATSFSAAVAIAHRILTEGAPYVAEYKRFLSGGCTKPPVELLKITGVDLESPQPIQDALDVFGTILEELEEMYR